MMKLLGRLLFNHAGFEHEILVHVMGRNPLTLRLHVLRHTPDETDLHVVYNDVREFPDEKEVDASKLLPPLYREMIQRLYEQEDEMESHRP